MDLFISAYHVVSAHFKPKYVFKNTQEVEILNVFLFFFYLSAHSKVLSLSTNIYSICDMHLIPKLFVVDVLYCIVFVDIFHINVA